MAAEEEEFGMLHLLFGDDEVSLSMYYMAGILAM